MVSSSPPTGEAAAGHAGRPSPEEIQAAIERIVASDAFRSSPQLVAFLRYVTTQVLAGNAVHLKAYTVAVEGFGRSDTFDPQSDPIVRVEAARLRRTLEHYYLEQGIEDRVLIELPRGKYVPIFSYRDPSPLRRGIVEMLRRPVVRIHWEPNAYTVLGAMVVALAVLGALDFFAKNSCAAY